MESPSPLLMDGVSGFLTRFLPFSICVFVSVYLYLRICICVFVFEYLYLHISIFVFIVLTDNLSDFLAQREEKIVMK